MRSPNDEGSQFSKLHFPCNKEEKLVLNSFFREYNLYLKKKTLNLFKVAYHPVSCLLHLHTSVIHEKKSLISKKVGGGGGHVGVIDLY